jgi:signal transduction histidine kinase/CheY-like chemotaxis protein
LPPSSSTTQFRRLSAPVLLAVLFGVGAATLNVLLARQLTEIERDARALVETWIARSATLATLEDGLREFRRHEALYALSTPADSTHAAHIVSLDSLRTANDSALAVLQQLDQRVNDSSGTAALRTQWTSYRELQVRDRTLPSGDNSPTLQNFRSREPLFQALISEARQTQQSMRAGAEGIALRSQRSTQSSRGLMVARLLLLVAMLGFAELLRRSWKERAEAERALAQAERALAQSRRIEAVGTLAGGVAHDLNNVLAAVTGYAQLAQLELEQNHPAQSDLAAITAAADRGAALVRRVLQFARQRPTQKQAVEVAELVHEVTQLLRPQLPPHVKVSVELPDHESHVLADPTELHQVIVNIAANAVHAMQTRGTTLAFRLTATARDVTLVITDDGDGMTPDVLERAIEPFFTTRDFGDGTGMGLAVAHGVVTGLGGALHIESSVGDGTRVTVTLPRAPATAAAPAHAPNPVPSQPESLHVIVVDDDPQVRNAVVRLIERAGHTVDAFAAAAPALEVLRADPSRADVVLTDLTMPVMNGMEFAAALARLDGAPPVVMCSGYLDIATTQQARSLGIVALLDKPVEPAALLRALKDSAAVRAK